MAKYPAEPLGDGPGRDADRYVAELEAKLEAARALVDETAEMLEFYPGNTDEVEAAADLAQKWRVWLG